MTVLNRKYDSTHHPDDEHLISYFAGKLPESTHESVQAHLVDCDRCLGFFQDVRDFFESSRGNEEMITQDRLRAWSTLWAQVRDEQETKDQTNSVLAPRAAWFNSTAKVALAAMLLVILGLGIWAIRQWDVRRQFDGQLELARQRHAQLQSDHDNLVARTKELEQENLELQKRADAAGQPRSSPGTNVRKPELNPPIYDLYARNFTQRSGDQNEINHIRVPATAGSIILILNGDGVAQAAGYGVEIVGENGKVIWSARGLRRGQLGNFTLAIGRSFLSKGTYRLKLYSQSSKPLAEYVMRIE